MAKTKLNYELPPGRLWPNTPKGLPFSIPVIGGTGDWATGKTLFGLSIAPGMHPEGHEFAGKPRTLYFDFEESGASYGGTGCERIDVPRKMLELRGDNYTPQDVALWFVDYLLNKIRPRQYDVVMGDPITTVEAGVADYVRKHHDLFGLTANQIAKSEGLFWGAVKDYYERVLLKLNAKCQTFYYTTHLRQQYEGNTPVRGKKEPKGKDTLFQLSSLYLWFERLPDKSGKAPSVPSAKVLKERCSETWVDEDGSLQITQFLPPRLPQATVHAIRCYIANPPVYAKLKDDEKVIEPEMSEADKLQLQLAVAEAEERASGNRIAMLARQEELRRLDQSASGSVVQSPDQSGQMLKQQKTQQAATTAASDVEQAEIDRLKAEADAKIAAAQAEGAKLAASSEDEANANKPCEAEIQSAKLLFGMLKLAPDVFKARCGGKVFSGLTRPEAQRVLTWLAKLKDVKEMGESIRTAKGLSDEAWRRIFKDKILAPVGAESVEKLDDENLDSLIGVLKNEQAKCVAAQKEAAAKN